MNSIWTKFKESKVGISLSNPIVGLALSCALAVFVGYFFYKLGDKSPHLAFRASPVRSSIVSAGGMSDLSVSFMGKKVISDLTVMQVAIWNSGKGSIRHENILEPIAISAGTNVPIYSATIRTVTRGVVGFNLITNELSNGKLSFDWKIMEHNDGASIQILYGGNQDVRFKSEGIIEGQDSINFYVASNADETSRWAFSIGSILWMLMVAPVVVGGILNQVKFISKQRKTGTIIPKSYYIFFGSFFLIMILATCGLSYLFYRHYFITNLPPFGF